MSEKSYLDRLYVTRDELRFVERELKKRNYEFDELIHFKDEDEDPTNVHIFQTIRFRSTPNHCHILLPAGIKDHRRIVKIKTKYFLMYSNYEDIQTDYKSTIRILSGL